MKRLMETKPRIENRLEQLKDFVTGFETGRIFMAALELDVFTNLKELADAPTLASRIGTRPGPTEKFLDVLAGMGILLKDKDLFVTYPDFALFLVKDSPVFWPVSEFKGRLPANSYQPGHTSNATKRGNRLQPCRATILSMILETATISSSRPVPSVAAYRKQNPSSGKYRQPSTTTAFSFA